MDGPENDEPAALNLHELCKFLAHFVQKISYVRLGALPPCWGRGGLFEKNLKSRCRHLSVTNVRENSSGRRWLCTSTTSVDGCVTWHFSFVQNENDAHLRCFLCAALLWPFICHLFPIWTVRGKQQRHFGGFQTDALWMNSSKRVLKWQHSTCFNLQKVSYFLELN